MKPRLALFDLDHTLLPIDSDYAWGEFTIEIGWCDAQAFRARNNHFYEQYKAGQLDIHDYVRFATDAVRLKGPEDAAAAHLDFMHSVIRPALRSEALELVAQHRAQGDTTLIVTATNEFVTGPIAALFQVDGLIAVELERDGSGWINGQIRGVPSAREGKVTRMTQWLESQGRSWGDVHTTFYTDSINDIGLLERVDEPVATNPDERLRAVAHARGWRILDLFKHDQATH